MINPQQPQNLESRVERLENGMNEVKQRVEDLKSNLASYEAQLRNRKSRKFRRISNFFLLIFFAALAIVPLLLRWLGILQGIQLPQNNEFDFLVIVIALATYVAAVRLALIGRLGSGSRSPQVSKIIILSLIPADFNLIVSGIIMIGKVFCSGLISEQTINTVLPYAAVCFVYAVLYLALEHVVAWGISVFKFLKVSNHAQ